MHSLYTRVPAPNDCKLRNFHSFTRLWLAYNLSVRRFGDYYTTLFADDTNILVSSSGLNELNSILCSFSEWFQNNQLVLNLNKMHIVIFASSKLLTYPLNTVYNNQALTVTENIKFLGMCLDCSLTWKSRIDNLIKKLSSICFMLRKLLPIVNVKMLRMVYFAHFYSQISYSIIFWGSSSAMRNIFIIQKRAIRIMLRLGPGISCREGFKKLDILTVPCLYIYALMLFAVKNLNTVFTRVLCALLFLVWPLKKRGA